MLFVYGTLLPGHVRWPLIERFVAATDAASVPGRLFDTGHGYPAARFDVDSEAPSETDYVDGVVVRFHADCAGEAWAVVEAIEGDLYERVTVTTTDGVVVESFAWAGTVDRLRRLGTTWLGA